MSDDEVFALVISGIVAIVGWWKWFMPLFTLRAKSRFRGWMVLAPAACAGVLFLVLRFLASHDVRDSGTYLFFYMVMGAAWAGTAMLTTRLVDVHVRDDVLERGNGAAAAQALGALLAFTLAFAGANIGDGPGWWVVVFCAGMASAALFLCWIALAALGRTSEQVTVDRDVPAGVRIAAWLVAMGLILGRAVAGDWTSAPAAVADFAQRGWPAAVLLALAIVLERVLRRGEPSWSGTVVAAGTYLAAGGGWVAYLGVPE